MQLVKFKFHLNSKLFSAYHKYGILVLKICNIGELLRLKAYLFIKNSDLNRHPVFSVSLHFTWTPASRAGLEQNEVERAG